MCGARVDVGSAAAAAFFFDAFSRGFGLDFSNWYVVDATSRDRSSRSPTFGPTMSLKPHGMIEPGIEDGLELDLERDVALSPAP